MTTDCDTLYTLSKAELRAWLEARDHRPPSTTDDIEHLVYRAYAIGKDTAEGLSPERPPAPHWELFSYYTADTRALAIRLDFLAQTTAIEMSRLEHVLVRAFLVGTDVAYGIPAPLVPPSSPMEPVCPPVA